MFRLLKTRLELALFWCLTKHCLVQSNEMVLRHAYFSRNTRDRQVPVVAIPQEVSCLAKSVQYVLVKHNVEET